MTQIKVGIFVAAGLSVLFTTIFMLGSNKSLFQQVVEIHSFFDSVQGLNKGSIVSLAGVKVGNIDRITFNENKNLVEVVAIIDTEYISRIKKDSRVEIRTQGALGDKFLYITPGTSGAASISHGDELVSDYGNDILSIISKRGNESENLFDILIDIKKITHALTENNRINHISGNLEKTTENLNRLTDKLNKALETGSLDRSMNKLERILDKVDRGEGTLGALVNDRTIHERIKTILGAGQQGQHIKNILKSSVEE